MSLDEFLADKSTQFSSDSTLAPYYNSRAKAIGSPVKKEAPELKLAKRRQTKASADEIVAIRYVGRAPADALPPSPATTSR